jgi:hypothetical protein
MSVHEGRRHDGVDTPDPGGRRSGARSRIALPRRRGGRRRPGPGGGAAPDVGWDYLFAARWTR